MKNKIQKRTRFFRLLLLFMALFFISVFAKETKAAVGTGFYGNAVYYNGVKIGTVTKKTRVTYIPSSDGNANYNRLTYLLSGNDKRTVVIPKGSNIFVNGPLRPGSNKTIVATGAKLTFKSGSNAIFTEPNKHVSNLKIKGGTWRSKDKYGRTGSLFVFAFATNVRMTGVDCNANYIGHSIEIIACNKVTIKNCKVAAIGKNPANCLEEQIQIDLATKKTAPKIAEYGSQYAKGQTCKNIYIIGNTVSGARPVGVNWSYAEKNKWINKFHENIVIKNNNLTATTSEGLSYFNCVSGEISGNTVVTKATRKTSNGAYTVGIHVAVFGTVPASQKNKTLTIKNNLVWGNRNGIHIKGYCGKGSRVVSAYGKVKVTGNAAFCKKGAASAIVCYAGSCKSYTASKNTAFKW